MSESLSPSVPPAIASTPVGVFDFDGTLTRQDSLFPFLRFVAGSWGYFWGCIAISPILAAYALRLMPNWDAKQRVLSYFLKGKTEEELSYLGESFALQVIPTLLRPEAVERLRWHQAQGHKTMVISASLETYLLPWIQSMGINQLSGTQLQTQGGRITGKILGKNCYGPEKVERLRSLLGDLSQYCVYAYGDSKGDRELLAIANYPYYRTFADAETDTDDRTPPPSAPPRWERGLILSVVVAAALYLGIVLWSGADKFWAALNLIPFWVLPALLGVIFFGYCLRFIRWQWYLKEMGYSVPIGSSFQIFLASFALTASPGKAGESIKSLFLKRRHNIPIPPTLAGLFCERFTDVLSIVLLIVLGISSKLQGQWAIATIGAIQIAVILLLQNPTWLKRYILSPLSKSPRLHPIIQKVETLIDSTSALLKPRLILGGTLLAFVAWGLEGICLYVLFQWLGATSVTPYQSVLTHTGAGLLGALTFSPGGIGGAELVTISMAMFYGASQTAAVTATFLIRLMTLWFAVAIGIVALLSLQRRS